MRPGAGDQHGQVRAGDDVSGQNRTVLRRVGTFKLYVLKTSPPVCDSETVVCTIGDGSPGKVVPGSCRQDAALLRQPGREDLVTGQVHVEGRYGTPRHGAHVCGGHDLPARSPFTGRVQIMTLGEATAEHTDETARAYGYAQRRSWIFWAWWYGAVLAGTGAVDAVLLAIFGQNPERGVTMVIIGAAVSVLGWLVTLGVRFSRKPPKPATDLPRLEQGIRINPGVVKFLVVAAVLIPVALALFTPNGASPETSPILGFIGASILGLAAGMARSGWLFRNSSELYRRWLQRQELPRG